MKTDIRKGESTYFDDANFPRGFSRSGEFNVAESKILSDYGITLKNLVSGSLEPSNSEENRFIQVFERRTEAESQIEKTWQKYLELTMTPKKFQSIYGSHRPHDDGDYVTDDGFDDL